MLDAEMKLKLLMSNRPWEHEPDNEEWVHELTGYKCTVWRHPTLGHLNGYVAIPKGHKKYEKDYKHIDVDVHGGLTYSELDKETDEWVVGFDCGHGGDFSPKLVVTLLTYTNTDVIHHMKDEYRTFAWVKEEVCSLARQLKLLDMKDQGETK